MHTSEVDIAWAAGIFEGEGSVIYRPTGGGRPGMQRRLAVKMTDRDVLEHLQSILGGTVRGPDTRTGAPSHWKPVYSWNLARWPEVERVLQSFLPYLGERRKAAALNLLANPAGTVGGHFQVTCKRGHDLSGDQSDVYEHRGVRHCRKCIRVRRGIPEERARGPRGPNKKKRLVMEREPDLADIFETRALRRSA